MQKINNYNWNNRVIETCGIGASHSTPMSLYAAFKNVSKTLISSRGYSFKDR